MSIAWPPYTKSRFVLPSTKACRPWVGACPHTPLSMPWAEACATMYQAVNVVPKMAMNEKMRMFRKDGMNVVVSPTPPNKRA